MAGKLKLVLEQLRPQCEASALAVEESPVRVALRYLGKRPDKLDYPFAVKNDLSVGAGFKRSAPPSDSEAPQNLRCMVVEGKHR